MIIQHNLSALRSLNHFNNNNKATSEVIAKLSSGWQINKAADNAAGLAISEKMRAQIRGLERAQQNIQDGISLIQTAEGGLASIHDPNLLRLRELAIQAATDTLTDSDRMLIQKEVEQIKQGINAIANNTEFNGIKLLNRGGTSPKTITETTEIIVPGYYEATPSVVDLSQATSITIFELTSGSHQSTFNVSSLVSGQSWEPVAGSQEKYIFSVDLANNTFTTTALYNPYNSYPGNNITGVRVNGLTGYADTTVWASAIVANSAGTIRESLNGILGSNLSDFPLFDWSTPHDTFITVEFHSKKYIPESTTTITSTKVIEMDDPDLLILHTGANGGQSLEVELCDARTKALGIDQLDYSTRLGAEAALAKIDEAVKIVSSQRGQFGAYQNRLEYTYNNSMNYSMNLTAAQSRIRDTDMAKAAMGLVKGQILTQASQTMLSQANQQPQKIMELLR